ncbi:MAG: NupC/NupG family nucleoside CNT transporter [Bacteriovoracaceae bacterium]|nr:NupC/NupG family nucleoside CNT transporter [Bacteriovoracaceae bacterium]
MERLISLLGLAVMVLIAYALSANRKKIVWKTVLTGIGLQLIFGAIILNTDAGRSVFEMAKNFFNSILSFTAAGSGFLFGTLVNPGHQSGIGFIFATMVLPTIIFFSSFMSVLYHLGVMKWIVKGCAWVMVRIMGTSGAESLSAAANIFVGQTEAPLVIKPYIGKMTKSELMALMTGGMATVAGGVLAAYVGMGIDAGHLLAASVMSAPAALVCAKLLIPETEVSETAGTLNVDLPVTTSNVIDAAASGASDGLKLALNVGAMLLAFIALIAMLNAIIGWCGGLFGFENLTFQIILGYVFAPIAWLMGVPWGDCINVGSLLGVKMVLNEFVAYDELAKMMANLQPRSIAISTYALCGFANFSSIAIQVGGIGVLAPERRKDLAELGMRSLLGGTLACFMTACVAGLFL